MKKIKPYLKYIFIFFFCFFAMSFFFSILDTDVLWNYGFSYALHKGELPYIDFNMIVTPLYPFLMSLPFYIFGHSILVFYLVNSFLFTVMFYFLFKLFDYKAWYFLLLLIFPIPALIFPTYNFFLLFLFVLLIYLEKNNKSDYLIGLVIACAFLTKQTVGLALLLPSFYYLVKNHSKFLKRFFSFCIPTFLFFIYLLLTNSFSKFFDLCFLSMFDFAANNKVFSISFLLGILLLFLVIRYIMKHKDNITGYYVLAFSTITIPLFDIIHVEYFVFVCFFLILDYFKFPKKQVMISMVFLTIFYTVLFFFSTIGFSSTYPNSYHNFEVRNLNNKNGEFIVRDKINQYLKENKDIILLGSDAYFYKITNELPITHFDLINKGNFGYQGTKKMKKEIDKLPSNTIFIIDYGEYSKKNQNTLNQMDYEVVEYVMNQSQLLDTIGGYRIYKKNDVSSK